VQAVESVRNAEDGRWRALECPRRPNPLLLMRCRGRKPRRVPSGCEAGVDLPACPEGAREARRGVTGNRRMPVRGAERNTGSAAETAYRER